MMAEVHLLDSKTFPVMIHLLDAQLHTAVLDTFEAEFGKRPADAQIQIQTTAG